MTTWTNNELSKIETAEELDVSYIYARDISGMNLASIRKKLSVFMRQCDIIHLTLCADVFSSAYAPGVSSPQPFGLEPETVLNLIKHILHSKKVVGVDIAEVSPRFDQDKRTSKLMAIVVFSIINTILNSVKVGDL